jgi:hypothetical protein
VIAVATVGAVARQRQLVAQRSALQQQLAALTAQLNTLAKESVMSSDLSSMALDSTSPDEPLAVGAFAGDSSLAASKLAAVTAQQVAAQVRVRAPGCCDARVTVYDCRRS